MFCISSLECQRDSFHVRKWVRLQLNVLLISGFRSKDKPLLQVESISLLLVKDAKINPLCLVEAILKLLSNDKTE